MVDQARSAIQSFHGGAIEVKKVIVVTGGGQGIGLAICNKLASDKSSAIAIIEKTNLGHKVAAQLQKRGIAAISVQADVSKEKEVKSAQEEISNFGVVKSVVNNAGIFPRQSALEIDYQRWLECIEVNLGGTFLVSRAFAPQMLESGEGTIVNITSGRAVGGAPLGSHYASSKGGIISLTRSLALEWAPLIRVNAVMPGVTDTAQPREAGISDEELYNRGSKIPLGRIGDPADIANMVSFLISPEAKYITGQTFAVNGGAIMR